MTLELSQLGFLLFIAALVAMATRRLHIPYTVGLVLAGMALYLLPVHFALHLSRELIFSVFLPPLVFEAAFQLRWAELRSNLPVIVLLATLGVVVAAAITGVGMHYAVDWNWGSAFVFGVLIAATDPVSVIATFKEAGVQGRLRLLLESESLLNDGTAAVLFVAAVAFASGGTAEPGVIAARLIFASAGGASIGILAGVGAAVLAGRSRDPLIEITFTTLAAYGAFDLAEHFHCSGVLAALSAGLTIGNLGALRSRATAAREAVESFWEYVVFVINSLVFLLIGASITQQHFGELWPAIVAAIALVTLGRAVAIYPLCAPFSKSRLAVAMPHQHVLFWGGLRGALALALALGIPEALPQRDAIVTVSFAVVAFSIFIQGLTIPSLLRRLNQRTALPEAPRRG